MNHLQTVRGRVIAAVPDILKLEFGCEVELPGGFIRPLWEVEYDDDENVSRIFTSSSSIGMHQYTSANGFKILGRKITLADVLVAIVQKPPIMELMAVKSKTGTYLAMKTLMGGDCNWNLLTDDLNLQSPETIEFLYNLLK